MSSSTQPSTACLNKYSGTLSYSDGRLTYEGNQAPPHALSIRFDATPTTFHLSPAKILSGNSQLVLTATLQNYSAPIVQAQYNCTVDGKQLAGILGDPSIPQRPRLGFGQRPISTDCRPSQLMQSIVVNGDLRSAKLIADNPRPQAEVTNIAGHYSLIMAMRLCAIFAPAFSVAKSQPKER